MTKSGKLTLLFSLTYMVSYLTRINYGAVVSEIGIATGFSKSQLSIALTGSFIMYGVGQIFSGVLGDKFAPKSLVMMGLITTVLMNFLLPFCASYWLMAIVWSVNGLAQAFMWPPLVKLMVALLRDEEYSSGIVKVSWGSSIGTILIYLLSPLIIAFCGWQGVFWFSALCGIVMMVFWGRLCPSIKAIQTVKNAPKVSNTKIFTPVFFVLAIAIVICGMLRDGVSTWTPSLISESFNLSSSSGILSGAALPVFGVICYEFALLLYNKRSKNPIVCGGIIFAIGVVSGLVLSLSIDKSPILSVISIALFNGSMHGVNLMLICMTPSFYSNTGKVSTISGVLNSFIYIGSAVSTYGIAFLTESFGWNATVWVWLCLAILGTAVCFAVAAPWKREVSESFK